MKNKKLGIFLIMLILTIIATVFVIISIADNHKFNIDSFEHRDFLGLEFEKYNVTEEYEIPADCYWGTIDDSNMSGNYYAAKMYYQDGTIVIEENVVTYKDDMHEDEEIIESLLYSEQKLNKEYISKYVNQMHDSHACGVIVETFKSKQDNYYYVKYKIPGEC
jgi:hypothetical protein